MLLAGRGGSVRNARDRPPSIRLQREQTLATAPNDIDAIRQQMAQIRHELHQDVRGVVENAEAVTDWRRYYRMYPWACLAVAFAIGYLIVPKRRRKIPRDLVDARRYDKVREDVQEAKEPAKKAASKGVLGAIFGMLVPVVVRAAQGYAVQYFESWLAQQQSLLAGLGAAAHPAPGGPGQADEPGETGESGAAANPGDAAATPARFLTS